jgi:hypothetical protein
MQKNRKKESQHFITKIENILHNSKNRLHTEKQKEFRYYNYMLIDLNKSEMTKYHTIKLRHKI